MDIKKALQELITSIEDTEEALDEAMEAIDIAMKKPKKKSLKYKEYKERFTKNF